MFYTDGGNLFKIDPCYLQMGNFKKRENTSRSNQGTEKEPGSL